MTDPVPIRVAEVGDRDRLWVEEVMVAEEARRRGVGRALVRRAEQWGAQAGAAYVALASERAGSFYRALGYEESATFYKKSVPPLSRNG